MTDPPLPGPEAATAPQNDGRSTPVPRSDAGESDPTQGMDTWTVERLEAFTARTRGPHLEAVRVLAQAHAYSDDEPRAARLRWARLALLANERLDGDGPWNEARTAHQDFMLRMWVIDELGPGDGVWSPERLAADTDGALPPSPDEARALAAHWRDLPVERIGELRRLKNLTAHLPRLLPHLHPGPVRDRLLAWAQTRRDLP
ncbi:hypothetical protein ACWERY_38785 [Streptomyces sp. NPDC004082]